eukprot:TRINITY_DN20816_c0_g4_i1.p1 TRINITY_DN20816_c0_g4~~TRINITY_DN20816_c0_g4_i1.p1  ORF type:complete len:869 (-),score=99.65 TRINITY_DN20816_c0_g4_i1:393-2999(-)
MISRALVKRVTSPVEMFADMFHQDSGRPSASSHSLLPESQPHYSPLDMTPTSSQHVQDTMSHTSQNFRSESSAKLVEFVWNGKLCQGRKLHRTIYRLDNEAGADLEATMKALGSTLDRYPDDINVPFTYSGGSGQAIHLAATRSSVQVVELLLERKADINAEVLRITDEEQLPYYNVLTAAVFSENRGGSPEVVRYLLEQKADMAPNSRGLWPLHFAFIVGSPELIKLVRDGMRERKIDEKTLDGSCSPLSLGIKHTRMRSDLLALCAPVTPASLCTFINFMPECVLPFMARATQSKTVPSDSLAEAVTIQEFRKVFLESPEAGCALLYAMSAEPAIECPRWHPLPKRASFMAGGFSEWVHLLFNEPELLHTQYTPECSWKFNIELGVPPGWHRQYGTSLNMDDQEEPNNNAKTLDAEFKVCHLPNIICADIFQCFSDATDDTLFIFDNLMVKGLVSYVWWHGACKVIVLRAISRILELFVLLLAAGLAAHGNYSFESPEVQRLCRFVGFRGVIDLVHESALLIGLCKAGMLGDYGKTGLLQKFMDWAGVATSICLILDPTDRIILVWAALSRWMLLGQVFLAAEKIASIVVPLNRLVAGVVPATLLTLTAFAAIMHAMFCLQDAAYLDEEVQLGSFFDDMFSLLFANEVPHDAYKDAPSRVLIYLSTLLFSIFYLNIFIAILGEHYSEEIDKRKLVVLHKRSVECFTFLTRAQILPTTLCTSHVAIWVFLFAAIAAFAIQFYCWFHGDLVLGSRPCFITCLVVMYLASFQNSGETWTDTTSKRYFWLIFPWEPHRLTDRPGDRDNNNLVTWGVYAFQKKGSDFFFPTPKGIKRLGTLNSLDSPWPIQSQPSLTSDSMTLDWQMPRQL